jgi:hypothetical protein
MSFESTNPWVVSRLPIWLYKEPTLSHKVRFKPQNLLWHEEEGAKNNCWGGSWGGIWHDWKHVRKGSLKCKDSMTRPILHHPNVGREFKMEVVV